ncbi:response regulator [Corallococcus sp. CA053C]|uniref:response regulator n=1 Tax=Corallococcus sp. CA053C TaxID=2316732 RepID=UPI000EA38BBA|nr:response regulator [Corallococcus sp. CA053C]RKG93228.1 response regulator [Corallococcus sp. CA053C]
MGNRPTVLVLNGSEDLIEALEELLDDAGFQTKGVRVQDIVRGPVDFTTLVRETRPAVIVYDISVPFDLSWSAFQKLAASPVAAGIPFVLTTTNREGAEEYTGPDVIELLLKPYDIQQFTQAVSQAVNRGAGAAATR